MKLLLLTLLIASIIGCTGRKENTQPAQVKDAEQAGSPEFEKAKEFYSSQMDSAFYYFNMVVNNSKDSQEIAVSYNYMGLIQSEAGDYFGSEESLLGSIKHLNKNRPTDHYSIFYIYTMLGNNYKDLKNYEVALAYYDSALKFAYREDIKAYPLNGKAVVYQKLKQYEEAVKIYNAIIGLIAFNKIEYPRILSNRAMAKWLMDPLYPALPEFWTAMQIRMQEQDDWGLNASYSHLCDYYSKPRPDSALFYARKMYTIAQKLNSVSDQLEALLKLSKFDFEKQSSNWIDIYQQLNDSLLTARHNEKNQLAFIRYESEKNKADKLALQRDVAENEVQLIRQQITIYTILALLAIGVAAGLSWYKRRKRRMEEERENAVRETELKLSRRVHDVVANGLYGIMKTIEHGQAYRNEQLIDRLEILYERSRDISYEIPTMPVEGFQQTITQLLTAFAGPGTKVVVVGNSNDLWDKVDGLAKKELEPVLQELMVNMKKHSGAKNVVIRFEEQDGQLAVLYQDDGIGLPKSFRPGNGLTNTGNRIKSIGGDIIFDGDTPNGLKLKISFPIAQSK